MLLVENLPQPVGLVVRGEAGARETRLRSGNSHCVPRHWTSAALS